MKITWDSRAKAVYIYLAKPALADKTIEIVEGILVDYSENGIPIGIEILNATKPIVKSAED